MINVDGTKTKTILGVQYLRGIAAMSVVLCHFGSGIKSYPMLAQIFNAGQNGVQVFFLISGFIIVFSMNAENYKTSQFFRFLLKRSIRIDPSYFITIILTILVFKCLSLIPSFKGQSIPFIPGQFLAHIFYMVPFTKYPFYNHVFWTLCIEFQFYLLIGVLYFLIESSL
jgi:peptidoglycan/LPS O-acetylase OafA/YrhL